MFCVSDVSDLVNAEKEVQNTRSLIKIVGSRTRFRAVVDEARSVFSAVKEGLGGGLPSDIAQRTAKTTLHTLKGNFGVYGLSDLVEKAHALEEKESLTGADVGHLETSLKEVVERHFNIIGLHWDGSESGSRVELSREEFNSLRAAVRREISDTTGRQRVDALLADFSNPMAGELTGPLEDLCAQLAARFGRKAEFHFMGSNLRVPENFRALLGTCVHLLRNSLDHGVETPSRRGSKPATGSVGLAISRNEEGWEIRFFDDGAGLDTDAIRAKAVAMGLYSPEKASALPEAEARELIFHPHFSTAKDVTDISGRGLGMTAVRNELERLGGSILIETERGRGTAFILRIPQPTAVLLAAA
jgi:two-component system chemotaxis sensor kinase CheA